MTRSEQIGELAAALSKAQAKIEAAPKDNIAKVKGKTRDGRDIEYSYNYSTLADVWAACRAPLSENGLAIVQTVIAKGQQITVSTLLAHAGGQWISEDLTMTAGDEKPQSIGTAITYARRYALGAIVGVVSEEDDDGAQASGRDAMTGRRPNNGHNGNGERPTSTPAKPAEASKEDPSVALCTAIKGRILKCPSVAEMVKLDTEIADAHKAHSINDKQKAWLGEIVSARLKDIKLTQEQAA